MPVEILATTEDDYVDELSIGPSQQIESVQWQIAAPNFAKYQLATRNKSGQVAWLPQDFTAASGVGGYNNVHGVRFKSFTPGLPTAVDCIGYFTDDPAPTGLQGSSVASSFSTGGTTGGSTVVVTGTVPQIIPVYVADPGPGVSSIDFYEIPPGFIGRFDLVSYQVLWDSSGGLGDRAVLYDIVDESIAQRFVWGQPGNTIYSEGATTNSWIETDVGTMGNYLRTIINTIADDPFDFGTGADFEQASAPFGDQLWPAGFRLRITVPHMAGTDEVSQIRGIVALFAI